MSNNFFDKFKNILGLNEDLMDEDDNINELTSVQEEHFAPPQHNQHVQPQVNHSYEEEDFSYKKKKSPRGHNIIDLSTPSVNEMIVVEPNSYDDAIKVVSLLKSKVAVIISFINSTLSHEDTMHIIDFICGAVCAIDGNQRMVTPGVYLFTPGNININSLDAEIPQNKTVDRSGNNLFLTVNDITLTKKRVTKVS